MVKLLHPSLTPRVIIMESPKCSLISYFMSCTKDGEHYLFLNSLMSYLLKNIDHHLFHAIRWSLLMAPVTQQYYQISYVTLKQVLSFFLPISTVEGIKSVPSVCVCVCLSIHLLALLLTVGLTIPSAFFPECNICSNATIEQLWGQTGLISFHWQLERERPVLVWYIPTLSPDYPTQSRQMIHRLLWLFSMHEKLIRSRSSDAVEMDVYCRSNMNGWGPFILVTKLWL